MIVAVDLNGGIGKDGGIPWHYKEDMQYFAKTTKGSTCIMGRITYDSIAAKTGTDEALLKGRQSIVISRNPELVVRGAEVVQSLSEALEMAKNDVFIIGGKRLYDEGIHIANEVHITTVCKGFDCDVSIDIMDTITKKFDRVSSKTTVGSDLIFEVFKRDLHEI